VDSAPAPSPDSVGGTSVAAAAGLFPPTLAWDKRD